MARRGAEKRAFAKSPPLQGKVPRALEPPEPEDKRPVWRFQILDYEGPFSCKEIGPAELERVIRRMGALESMTWTDIDKTGSHFIDVGSLSPAARKRLQDIGQDDVDQVYSLRIVGKERVFGIRDRWILKVMWWDPEHGVCPSHKKHT